VVVGIPDVITCANFGEDRLRGLGVAGGENLPFSIDFVRRPYNPYNILALPCECVIGQAIIFSSCGFFLLYSIYLFFSFLA